MSPSCRADCVGRGVLAPWDHRPKKHAGRTANLPQSLNQHSVVTLGEYLGCGTGELAARIRDAGGRVTAIDSDPANAALHWMTRPSEMLRSVHVALRTRGRFAGKWEAPRMSPASSPRCAPRWPNVISPSGFGRHGTFPPQTSTRAPAIERFPVARMEYFHGPTELTRLL